MNGNLLEAIQSLVKVKKVDADVVFDALEMVLLTAYKKETGSNAKTSIKLNRETGDYQIFEEKTVVESIDPESENAINEITVEDAKKIDRSYEAGDLLSIDVTPKNFGRIAAQTAKQVMIQKLREAERGSLYEEFSGRAGDVITGTVKWSESRAIFVDLGRCEGILPYAEQIEGEEFKANDKIKCYVLEVKKTTKGPEIILSRTHPGLLKRLFELEVPEIYSGTVEIKNVVREAGSRRARESRTSSMNCMAKRSISSAGTKIRPFSLPMRSPRPKSFPFPYGMKKILPTSSFLTTSCHWLSARQARMQDWLPS